jgi:hypothetical protein
MEGKSSGGRTYPGEPQGRAWESVFDRNMRVSKFWVDSRKISVIFTVLLRDTSNGGGSVWKKGDFFQSSRLEKAGGLAIISKLLRDRNQPSRMKDAQGQQRPRHPDLQRRFWPGPAERQGLGGLEN